MGFVLPRSPGALAGWMMLAFLAGVAAHLVIWPAWHLSPFIWTALIVYPVLLLGAQVTSRFKFRVLIILALILGLWRVDVAVRPPARVMSGRLVRVASAPTHPFMQALAFWRSRLTARVAATMPHDEAALVAGILYGDRDFSTAQNAAFRRAGLTHIVAVSGSNVTIVVQVIAALCLALGLRRRQAFFATTFVLCAFSAFVGVGASVLRAAFMGWLLLVAREVGRPAATGRLLLVAATILLLIDPWQVLLDPGFALSFLSMWGLLTWAPIFERWFKFMPKFFELRKTFAATCAATLSTAPYAAWMFGRFSLAGLVTNLFALPLIPFVMAWGAFAAFWGDLPGSAIVAAPAVGFVRAIFWIAEMSAYLPANNIRIFSSDLSTPGVVYVAMVYLWANLRVKNELSTEK